MTSAVLNINSDQQAWSLINEALEGKFDKDIVQLEFDGWPNFNLKIKGDAYDSTLKSSTMKSLAELQKTLNNAYANIIYGKSANSLTHDEREALEITFKIEKGSSDVEASLGSFLKTLAEKGIDKMNSKQLVLLVLGMAVCITGYHVNSDYLTSKAETERHERELALIENVPAMAQIQKEQTEAYTNILKSISGATEVTIADKTLNKEQIESITRNEVQRFEPKRLDGEYLITLLKRKSDRYKIDIESASNGASFSTELFTGHLPLEQVRKITNAFIEAKPVMLNVVGRVRGDDVRSASIVGVENEAAIPPVIIGADKKADT